MRLAIFSDVHGNLEALEIFLEALRNDRVDRLFCLGDSV
ncbi:MAG: metallophosphoesterase family protein, partial [Desulfomonilaceae bacterium]